MRALAAVLLATILLAGPAVADDRPFDRDCMDDYGRDLCDPAMRATIRAKFDLPTAQDLAAQGFEGVRVFTVNGYSMDMPPVSVLRKDAGPAMVEVRVGGVKPRTISAPASPWDWVLVRTLGDLATASAVTQSKPPPAASGEINICLHAWVTITEVLSGGKVVTRIRNACDDDPVFGGSFALSTLALGAFEGCWELDPAHYRNDSERLIGCAKLAGDEGYAAAALLNALQDSPLRLPPEAASPSERWLDPQVTLTWPGETLVSGREAVTASWAARGGADPNLWIDTVEVRDFKSGDVVGLLFREVGRDQYEEAPFRQAWVNDRGVWRMKSWTIEPFRTARR